MKNAIKTVGGLGLFGVLAYSIISIHNCKPIGPNVVTTQTTIKITEASTNLILASSGSAANYQGGKAQSLTIQNVGTVKALDVDSNLLSILNVIAQGLMVVDNNCPQDLEPNATCTFTFHPSIQLKPTKFKIHGINTNDVEATITVLDYGSQYQDGYVYALTPYVFGDDLDKNKCNPDTLEHCSKIVTLSNFTDYQWSGETHEIKANDFYNGRKNTKTIVGQYPNPSSMPPEASNVIASTIYAANKCDMFVSSNGYKDWYLPAICEMGNGPAPGCSKTQNIFNNLVNTTTSIGNFNGQYWSSTENAAYNAWVQDYTKNASPQQLIYAKTYSKKIACSRAITPENVVQ